MLNARRLDIAGPITEGDLTSPGLLQKRLLCRVAAKLNAAAVLDEAQQQAVFKKRA
jgi:hypothetical protein